MAKNKPMMNNRALRYLDQRIDEIEKRVEAFRLAKATAVQARDDEDEEPWDDATDEVAGELMADRYELFHKGFGRYVVKDNEMDLEHRAPDGGWLTKQEARQKMEELSDGA